MNKDELKRLAKANRQDEERRFMEDMDTLSRGGIPAKARERLLELRQLGEFNCNLSPNELSLLRRLEYEPIGTVSGSAMFHVGFFYGSSNADCEISEISNALDDAAMLAVSRLRQELQLLGAHGVLGVRLKIVRHAWADHTVEVQLLGTGVRTHGAAPAQPWLSTLSVQDWFGLKRAGYEPVGICWGFSSWFMLTTYQDEQQMLSFRNSELKHWSDSLRQARNVAMRNLRHWHDKLDQATGIVSIIMEKEMREVRGLTLYGSSYPQYQQYGIPIEEEEEIRKREHHILSMSIIGTAVRPRSSKPHYAQQTQHVISLRDGRLHRMIRLERN